MMSKCCVAYHEPMKLAMIQHAAVGHTRENNIARGLRAVEEASRNGADVVCFAELAFDLFHPQYPAATNANVAQLAEHIPGPTTEQFCACAKACAVVIVLNLFELDPVNGLTYDTSPIIDADGTILGKTRMVHITEYACFHEQGYYAPGDTGVPVYQTRAGKIGVAICYDRHYPDYSMCIDAGNPASSLQNEPVPNGGLINMGNGSHGTLK